MVSIPILITYQPKFEFYDNRLVPYLVKYIKIIIIVKNFN